MIKFFIFFAFFMYIIKFILFKIFFLNVTRLWKKLGVGVFVLEEFLEE